MYDVWILQVFDDMRTDIKVEQEANGHTRSPDYKAGHPQIRYTKESSPPGSPPPYPPPHDNNVHYQRPPGETQGKQAPVTQSLMGNTYTQPSARWAENTTPSTNFGLMLVHRLRRWTNISSTSVQRLVLAGS